MLDTPPMKRLLGWVVLTVALVFSSALCALQFGLRRFDRLVERDVEALLARATTSAGEVVVTEAMLKDFPEPVRRYLRNTGILGKPFVGIRFASSRRDRCTWAQDKGGFPLMRRSTTRCSHPASYGTPLSTKAHCQ